MPWKETCAMKQRIDLIEDWLSQRWNKTELAIKYGVSRPTVNKWINRFKVHGYSGLEEHSRRPKTSPNQTPSWKEELIIEAKKDFLNWGPKKVRDYLIRTNPEQNWPVDSTVGAILKRNGLVKPKRRKGRVSVYPKHLTNSEYPCHVWNIDFKGDRKLGSGQRCYPLTISDDFTRYLLCCKGLESTSKRPVKECLEMAFYEYGIPEVIKSDNGVPFASKSIGGLSKLAVWLIQLGVTPERIDKGKPTQNSRHERLHKTLQQETMDSMKYSMGAQQAEFDKFKYEYNELRSHESLNRQPPACVFKNSQVEYLGKVNPIEYDVGSYIRKVKPSGEIKWKGQDIYLGQVLSGEHVGLKPTENDRYEIYYSFLHIGYLNDRIGKIESIKSRT